MTHALCTVNWDHDSGLAEDRVVWTFHFDVVGNPPTAPEAAFIFDALDDFVTTTPPGASDSLQSLLSPVLTGTYVMKLYSMADPSPRVPRFMRTSSATLAPSDALPSEVALCLSHQAVAIPGQPQAERRGRCYLGPFRDIVLAGGVVDRPANATLDIVEGIGQALLDATQAPGSLATWVVNAASNNTTYPVDNGWVDNAFDTQRRRGQKASSRRTFS